MLTRTQPTPVNIVTLYFNIEPKIVKFVTGKIIFCERHEIFKRVPLSSVSISVELFQVQSPGGRDQVVVVGGAGQVRIPHLVSQGSVLHTLAVEQLVTHSGKTTLHQHGMRQYLLKSQLTDPVGYQPWFLPSKFQNNIDKFTGKIFEKG